MWKSPADMVEGFGHEIMQHFLCKDSLLANRFFSLGEKAFPGFCFVVSMRESSSVALRMQ